MKKTIIFYFSATGNSLYVAKEIAKVNDAELVSIPEAVNKGNYYYEGYQQAGFIMPLYFMGMPRMVWDFIEKLEFKETKYVFSIVTRAITKGRVFTDLKMLLGRKGLYLDYGRYITYPDSYIRWGEPVKGDKRQKVYEESSSKLQLFTKELSKVKKDIEKEGVLLASFGQISYKLWRARLAANYKSFKTDENCSGCTICTRACPAGNIIMNNDRPVWSNGCEDCMACVQHCPKKAIYFSKKTAKFERYRHPKVKIDELMHNNHLQDGC